LGGLWACAAEAAPPANGAFRLTAEERAFLAEHPEIRVGTMADWPPLNFTDPAGRPTGIGADLLDAMNGLLGGALRGVPGTFESNLAKTRNRELDALMDVTPKPEREAYLRFTLPYQDIPHVIVGRRNARYYPAAQALAGRTVALEKGFGNVQWFKENFPAVRIRLYESTRDALDAVARSQADAYAGNRAVATYLIEREMLTNLHLQGRLEKPSVVLAIGVRRDWPVAAALLDRALRHVLRNEGRAIQAKWFEASSKAGVRFRPTPEEQAWLAAHPRIRIGAMDNWPPMDFVDETGTLHGLGADFIGLLNELLDGRLEAVPAPFPQLLEDVRAGRLDALLDVTPRPDREAYLHFTKPYAVLPHAIVARKGGRYYDSFASLHRRTVAVEAGFFVGAHLRSNHPAIRVEEYPSTREALLAVAAEQADAYVGNRAGATWVIGRELLTSLQVQGIERETASVNAIGVRKDEPLLAAILDRALATLSQQSVQNVFERWAGVGQDRGGGLAWIRLTPEEKQWLAAHPVIRFGSNPRWAPLEFIDREGIPQGISHDYLKRFGQALGVDFRHVPISSWAQAQAQLRRGELDLLTSLNKAGARKDEFVFTPPYLSLQTAIFTREDTPYVGELAELKGRKVALVPGYGLREHLVPQCPEMEVVAAKDVPTALRMLEDGSVDAFVGSLLIASHYIQAGGHGRIKVAGETAFVYQPAFTCRKDWHVLADILDKALEDVDADEKNAIARKWMTVTYEQRIDYAKLYKIGAGGLALLLLFGYWNRRMAAEIRRRKVVEASLHRSETALLAANKELEAFSYSVSHDLRAPLRHVAGFVQLLQGQAQAQLDETGRRYLDVIAGAAAKMGALIDDLLSFSRTGRAQMRLETVPLAALVDECRRELEPETRGRSIDWRIGELPEVTADRALLRQVLANLLGNAVKYTGKKPAARIEVAARRDGGEIVVSVRDNGAGFDMKYADKLFGVFQRLHTEAEFEGTGIGLANVRRIVVRHGGRTWAEGAVDQGATFFFTLPAGAPAQEGKQR
jgi:ABC-type amino acid transport substrate-binding protein/nitrogen-specific signal transduction histidine kinase